MGDKRRKFFAYIVVSSLHKIPSKPCIKRIIRNEPIYSYESEKDLKDIMGDICWKVVYEDFIS